jgi:putative membrane protein
MKPAPHVAVPSDDAELVRRARARESAAFRTIMERHNRRLYRIARGILRNDSEAEDAVQEAYVNALTHLGGFRGDSSLATWLARITMNEALGRLRRKRSAMDLETFEAQRTEAQIIKFPQTVTSTNKDVRAFADGMVSDHTTVNDKALGLVKKLKVTLEENDTSRALTKQAAEKRAELAKLDGAEFDKAYIANEVAYHKTVNGALETTLIPSASNPELKSLLQTGLKIFQGHEQHAEQVAAELR